MPLRIPVDYNTMMQDPEERVYINTHRHRDLVDYLRPGLIVVLYDEVLEVEATVEYDAEHKEWLGIPNWSTSRDLPYLQQ